MPLEENVPESFNQIRKGKNEVRVWVMFGDGKCSFKSKGKLLWRYDDTSLPPWPSNKQNMEVDGLFK